MRVLKQVGFRPTKQRMLGFGLRFLFSESFRFEPSPAHDALAQIVPLGVEIRSIRVTRYKVFDLEDPQENNWLYR